MGHTVTPSSKAPFLNMTQYSLLTQVPSGKISSGLACGSCTWRLMRAATFARSAASPLLKWMHPSDANTTDCIQPTQPPCFCMMTAKGVDCSRTMKSIMLVWLATNTCCGRRDGRGPW